MIWPRPPAITQQPNPENRFLIAPPALSPLPPRGCPDIARAVLALITDAGFEFARGRQEKEKEVVAAIGAPPPEGIEYYGARREKCTGRGVGLCGRDGL